MRTLLLGLVLCTSVHADLLSPDDVVSRLVCSVKDDRLTRFIQTADVSSIASQPRHALEQESLLLFLKSIDPDKIIFATREGGSNIKWFPGRNGTATVRMIEPIRMDFELSTKKPSGGGEQAFRVTAIHP